MYFSEKVSFTVMNFVYSFKLHVKFVYCCSAVFNTEKKLLFHFSILSKRILRAFKLYLGIFFMLDICTVSPKSKQIFTNFFNKKLNFF